MRAKEFIVEAKPENLGEKVCHQLCKAWDGKKDNGASMDQMWRPWILYLMPQEQN